MLDIPKGPSSPWSKVEFLNLSELPPSVEDDEDAIEDDVEDVNTEGDDLWDSPFVVVVFAPSNGITFIFQNFGQVHN